MAKVEPVPFAHRVVDLPVMLVVDLPIDVLGLCQACARVPKELIMHCHGGNPGVTWFIGPDGRGVAAVDDREWSGLECRLEGGAIDELGPG
jgi:hypothetical protein